MTDTAAPASRSDLARRTREHHKAALLIFLAIVLAHWAEHLAQAGQIWLLGWSRPDAGGVLGLFYPWLVTSEWLHYGYAIVMLLGLWVLRHGMVGRARTFWLIAFWIQFWHHLEHLILLLQKVSGVHLAGMEVPTSFVQLVAPRVELHLFYNAIVFVPMVIAMYQHLRPTPSELRYMSCSCVRRRPAVPTG